MAKRTTQTTTINGKRVRLVTTATGVRVTDAPVEEWRLQAAQVRALRAMPEYGRCFLLVGGMEAARRGPRAQVEAKATGLTAGHPDLTIFLPGGKVAMIENKNAEGRLSKVQVERHAALARIGHHVVVIKATSEAEAAERAVVQVREWIATNDNRPALPKGAILGVGTAQG
jgi:hypothetical protein